MTGSAHALQLDETGICPMCDKPYDNHNTWDTDTCCEIARKIHRKMVAYKRWHFNDADPKGVCPPNLKQKRVDMVCEGCVNPIKVSLKDYKLFRQRKKMLLCKDCKPIQDIDDQVERERK